MREANVVDVAFQETGSVDEGRVYRFDVTLVHDDEGEDGYANWWQVEDLGGTQLGRRTLLHAHTNAPFTRSEQITVPTGVGTVVVRGHDQTHGYGGQVILVDMATGEEESVRQGSEPHSFAEE